MEICIGFIYNAPPNSRWYNPNFIGELEKEINGLRDEYPKTEFLLMGDLNCRVGGAQVDLPHSWDGPENVNKEFNSYGKRVSKDNICNGEGRQLIEFCERNTFDILNGKYGADIKGEFTFISQTGKSAIDYAVGSEGLIDNLVEFKVGNEVVSSHMPLLIEIGNKGPRKGRRDFVDKQVTYEVVKYRWVDRFGGEFLDTINGKVNEICMQGIQHFLRKDQVNEAHNLLLFSVRRAGVKMRCDRRRARAKEHWFDEECGEKRKQTKVALRELRDGEDDISRIQYWTKRKEYERLLGEKRGAWQKKEAEYINKLVYGKDVKGLWNAIRKIVKGREPTAYVEPNDWVKHFQGLFSRDSSNGLTCTLLNLNKEGMQTLLG
jgi:hypothetical protein